MQIGFRWLNYMAFWNVGLCFRQKRHFSYLISIILMNMLEVLQFDVW